MKLLIFLIFPFFLSAQSDSVKPKVSIRGNFQLTNNGISPVPYFTLDKPALLTNLYVTKGNLSFSPELNFDLQAKPWSVNTWVRYRLLHSNKFSFTVGNNFSLIFKRLPTEVSSDQFQVQRYQMFLNELSYKISKNRNLSLLYWKTKALDKGGIQSGNFLMLLVQFNDLLPARYGLLSIKASLFAIDNSSPFTGVFISQVASFKPNKFPILFTFQTVKPIYVTPSGNFKWNVGLNLPF